MSELCVALVSIENRRWLRILRWLKARLHTTEKKYISAAKKQFINTGTDHTIRRPVTKTPLKLEAHKTASATKAALVKKVQEKKIELKPEEEPEGHYELSPLMTKALESELKDLMEKVNKVLSANVTDIAEKLVVEKFKKEAGDTLRNTIGLTVTKRLLPLNTSLYVKMTFKGTPPFRRDLVGFIKKYEIISFKRVAENSPTFVAKLKNFQAFDILCTTKTIKCGQINVSVTPCYQFTHCPANLRTRYDGTNKTSKIENTVTKSQEDGQPQKTNENTGKETNSSKDSMGDIAEENAKKIEPNIKLAESKELSKPIEKIATQTTIKKTDAKLTQSAATVKKQNVTANVPTPSQTITDGKQNNVKTTPSKPNKVTQIKEVPKDVATNDQNAMPVAAKTPVKTNQQSANPIAAKSTAQIIQGTERKPMEVAKVTPTKTAAANPKLTSTKIATKAKETVTKAPSKPNPGANKVTIETKVAQKVPSTKKKESDFDELDDSDILALLSEGIVVDECSGSDDE